MHEHGVSDSPTDDEDSPVGPRPVSAKAVYRLADKLDLPALKLRAFQHISSHLTSQNIPAEVFSRFSSTFEDVRKVSLGLSYCSPLFVYSDTNTSAYFEQPSRR